MTLANHEPPRNHKAPDYLDTIAPLDLETAQHIEQSSARIPGFLTALFPNSAFPARPPSILGALDGHDYNVQQKKWMHYSTPTLQADDVARARAMATFLNEISHHCYIGYQHLRLPRPDARRVWMLTESIRVLPDGSNVRAVGAALVKAGTESVQWSDVLCDVQIAQQASSMDQILQQLSSGATNVLATQEDRHFHVGVAIAGDDIQVAYFDRAGRVTSGALDIHRYPVFVLRLVMGLTVIDESFGGKDTSIVTRGGHPYVTVGGAEYRIEETLSRFGDVCGRGTICWRCRRPGSDEDYVIKHSWAGTQEHSTEGQFLRDAERVAGVVDLVHEEVVVRSNGLPHNTVWLRDFLKGSERLAVIGNCPRLELRRLVLRTCGRPLADFSSKEELISALRDAVQASYDLFDMVNILHCDVNPDNIMLRRHPDSAYRRGFLIDLDSATYVSPSEGLAPFGHLAGTLFFMAIDVVQYTYAVQHAPWHDLESFLYTLMYICANYSEPSNTRRPNFDIYNSPLAPWFAEDAHDKACIMRYYSDTEFRAFLDSVFDPYFDDLKGLVCELRALITRRKGRPPVRHTQVLDVLDRHIRARTEARYAITPLDMPTIIDTHLKRKGGLKRKRERAAPAAPAAPTASTPPPLPALPIATPAAPASPTFDPLAPATPAAAPPAPSTPVAPPPRTSPAVMPLEADDQSHEAAAC
uniref:Protein kinase domain-containing protein n=1 Tax=Schizophyllum commune (strain H4-8 / FGSC 9210) TaxID=578458 RepID=D8Q2U8_SCHCM